MSGIVKQAVLSCRSPLIQFQRFRGKINIQRPRKPHYDRALIIATTKPIYPEEVKTTTCFQKNPRFSEKPDNPYNTIIAREVLNWLQQSRAIAFFHMNSIPQEELFKIRVLLHKQNMSLKAYGKKIIEKAVKDTRFEAIVQLFDSQHCIVFSPHQNIKPLLRITKKVPQMILMAGIIDDTLLSRNEFIAYAEHPGLEAAQVELVQTLNMAATNLVQNLEAHQNNFVNVLDVYAKSDVSAAAEPASEKKEDAINESDKGKSDHPMGNNEGEGKEK